MRLIDAWNLLLKKLHGWLAALVLHLPNLIVALFVVFVFWLLARTLRDRKSVV